MYLLQRQTSFSVRNRSPLDLMRPEHQICKDFIFIS